MYIVNINIKRALAKGAFHLSQLGGDWKLAASFSSTGTEGRALGAYGPNLKLVNPAGDDIVLPSTWDYRSAVGVSLYLSLPARPDGALSIGIRAGLCRVLQRSASTRPGSHSVFVRNKGFGNHLPRE